MHINYVQASFKISDEFINKTRFSTRDKNNCANGRLRRQRENNNACLLIPSINIIFSIFFNLFSLIISMTNNTYCKSMRIGKIKHKWKVLKDWIWRQHRWRKNREKSTETKCSNNRKRFLRTDLQTSRS